ncbi:Nucleotide-binding universal stress protein, UspA family [Desulfuromusa kysingii]|uniref:Universal stress protein n=1 Tax=Desulfuromusa kysingii TaxID=37625 RepID=A0A1H3VW61_9BACT|nr:universal stress protein [Desulfuromusa kysingii]SDZ79036.1 Nucleotide-binding universal stress protein, UspA family [Desulfuromusa kysingii]
MLPFYKTILVPCDRTPNSQYAFKHAVMISRRNNAKIHLLHVLPQVDSSMRSYISAVMGENKLEDLEHTNMEKAKEEMTHDLEEFAKKELADFPEDLARFAGAEVVIGHPVVKILEVAKQLDADLIVMGTHGKGAIEHAFLGSTAEKLLKKSKRPVFVIPLPE